MYLGDFTTANTVYVYFNTFDSNDPSASVTLTGLATSDIQIYKNGSTTQRSSTAGFTLLDTDGIDFDSNTGIHGFSIDLSNNTDSGFFAAGSEYTVVVASVTVDGATVNFVAATFSIERTGGALALLKGTNSLSDIEGKIDTLTSDLTAVKTKTDYLPSVTAGGSGGVMISGTNSGTTTLGALTVTGATTLTGAVTGSNASNNLRINGAAPGASGGLLISGSNSGTTTLGALTITGVTTHTGATTYTGAVTASNASNNFRVNGVAPGAAGGMFIAGTNAATTITTGLTTTFTGNLTGSVGSVTGAVGSVTGNVGGNVTGSVGSVTGHTPQTGDTYALANGSTGFAAIDTVVDAILVDTAVIGAAGAGLTAIPWNASWDAEVQSECTDALNAYDAPTKAELDSGLAALPTATQNADALLNRDMSAVSDTNARTPLNALRFLRNKWSVSGTTLSVTKEDDSTEAWTATVTADSGADPITGSDPA